MIISEGVSITSTIVNATNVDITWMVPSSVTSQGINAFSIALVPQCINGDLAGPTQRVDISDVEARTMASFGNLRKLIYCT